MAKTLQDLADLCQCTRERCIDAIQSGQAPGYRLGNRWIIPDEAFDLFSKGVWEPVSARVEKIQPTYPLVRTVRSAEPSS